MSILATKETVFEACREQCAERIRTGGPFQVLGGGTQYLGAAQERKSRTELRAPDKGWDYDPNALTLTVAAGVPLAQVSERLAAHNQRLGFEPPIWGHYWGVLAQEQLAVPWAPTRQAHAAWRLAPVAISASAWNLLMGVGRSSKMAAA